MDKSINILLIEDNSSDTELVRRMLRGQSSIISTIDCVQSVNAASEAIQRNKYDLIITDLGLPDSSGLDTVVRLRGITDRVPIIALTGEDDTLGIAAIRSGANDYIPKDQVSRPIISRAVNHAIERFQMTAELKEANALLENKNERLAKMYKMSQQFVDNVSHEFRTPLTVIREFAAIVRDGIDGPVTKQQTNRLTTLITRTDDLALMVEDLLDTSRLESGLLKTCRRQNNLYEIVAQVEKMLQLRASMKKIVMNVDQVPVDLEIFCDEEKLRRILINLIVNAIKFTPIEGQIEISAVILDSNRVKITVADTGPGIPKDDLDRIFERFQQVDAHHRMASCKGFGLGLSIARALASLNLGSLQVCSEEGQGSQFSILVPLARLDAVLNCYLDQRAETLDAAGQISIVEVRPGKFDAEHQFEVLDTIDDFLRSSVQNFDLVLQVQNDRWLIYTCNSATTLPEFLDRIKGEWSKLARNHFGATLPDLNYQFLETDCILAGREQFMKLALSAATDSLDQSTDLFKQGPSKRVLVVDDEYEVAAAIESRLQASGIEVAVVHDGQACLRAVEDSLPDAILLDIRMLKMDGLTVLERLKTNPATATIPVIMLSASMHDQQQALDRGASYFIRKPFKSDMILSALASVWKPTAINSSPSKKANGLTPHISEKVNLDCRQPPVSR